MNRAIFLDRDGTLIEEKSYLSNVSDIEFINGTIDGLKLLQDKYLLIIITNQSGVARGYFTEDKVREINQYIENKLLEKGIKITDTLYCPHYKNGIIKKYSIDCECRKPKTKLIDIAQKKYNINLNESYVVGDKDSDILLGRNANCKSILIKNSNYHNNEKSDYIASDILDAAKFILKLKRGGHQ